MNRNLYLAHHGILGMKWGIRRYQNLDGTLTPAGRERYSSDREQRKLVNRLQSRRDISRSPQVRHAVKELSEVARKNIESNNILGKLQDEIAERLYSNKYYERYLDETVHDYVKEHPHDLEYFGGIEEIKDGYRRGVFDHGDYSLIERYLVNHSNDAMAKKYLDALKKADKCSNQLMEASRKYVSEFLGDYGNKRIRLYEYPGADLEVSAGEEMVAILYAKAQKELEAAHSATLYSDELYHHGILGQKWGVRRWQNYDGTWTPAGREKYGAGGKRRSEMANNEGNGKRYSGQNNASKSNSDSEEDIHNKKGGHWKALGTAAKIAAGVALMSPTLLADGVVDIGMAGVSKVKKDKYEKERSNSEIDPETGFKLKSTEMSEKDDLKRVNPEYFNFNSNTKSNCMLCTTAYELRRRGYDVVAEKAAFGYEPKDILKWFPGAKINHIQRDEPKTRLEKWGLKDNYSKKIIEELKKQPNGSRGNFMFDWFSLYGKGKHSIFYEIKDGEVILRDAQVNQSYKTNDKGIFSNNINELLNTITDASFVRLDNLDFDKKAIKECARS